MHYLPQKSILLHKNYTYDCSFPEKDYKYRGNYMDDDEKTVSGLLEED